MNLSSRKPKRVLKLVGIYLVVHIADGMLMRYGLTPAMDYLEPLAKHDIAYLAPLVKHYFYP